MSKETPQNPDPKYAWRDLARTSLHKRCAADRLADFLEIYGPYDEAEARAQASRCVQCPEPSCVAGCPLGNRIPEWLALTAEGQFLDAAALLHSTSSLPEICARVCPAERLCEGMCILHGKAEPVSVWAIEQFLNEYAFAHGGAESLTAPANGLRVAVLGSGPGGLTCADVLSRRGYAVTVFDWRLVPGGLLVSGIPAFRLERSVVNRRIEMLQRHGVVFQLGVALGEQLSYGELRDRFDAIFLAFGARHARELNVPGRDLKGVGQALPFLMLKDADPPPGGPAADVTGKQVVVLGGGDMAMACLRTALRSGARTALCVYRRDEPSMPCIHGEYESALEEGAQFEFCALPVAVLGNAQGEVTGLRLVRTELGAADENGRRPFAIRAGTEFDLPADGVFLALGFDPEPLAAENPFGSLARNEGGSLRVDANQMTSVPGIFAGGDLVRGPSPVLDVVRDARKAAEGIDAYLLPGRKP